MSLRLRRELRKQLDHADNYEDWKSTAAALDELDGAAAWQAEDHSPQLAVELLRRDIKQIRKLRKAAQLPELAELLHESIYRHQGDLTAAQLYAVALTCTKQSVDDYLDEVTAALRAFVDKPHPELPAAARIATLKAAQKNLGKPALLLSGGAAMGFFHLGVVKALFEQGLLPDVICGSSIGSLVGGGVCARNDSELTALFEDLETIYRFGIQFLKPAQALRQGGLLNQAQYRRCAQENVGDLSFAEAAAHSGRQLCISVSPGRARQKPRVLSASTSPEVMISSAVVASSAIPGLFPPVTLQARKADGRIASYLPAERWVDGSFQGDLPSKRLGRLYNVNHFIVSQVNPHAVPFMVSRNRRGVAALATDLLLSSARVQTVQTLKVLQARVRSDGLFNLIEHARLIAEQDYRGDTNIHPPISAWMYRRMLSNPSVTDLKRYIVMGERATWPKLKLIRNQTRIQREIAACLERLERRDSA